MRVLIYTRSDAMGWVRCLWPGAVLSAAGYDVTMWDSQSRQARILFAPDGRGGAKEVTALPQFDTIVLQRVTQQHMLDAIRIWQSRGMRVVIDMDDNLRDITPDHNEGAYETLNSVNHISWRITDKACAIADAVVVSTPALQSMYGGTIVRNCVPGGYVGIGEQTVSPSGVIGWSGNTNLRMRDGAVVGAAVARLQRNGYELHGVGIGEHIERFFLLDRPPAKFSPASLDRYPHMMAQATVGIVPLTNNRFNRAKSWLKPLQYAALGVPVVCSPSEEYEALAAYIPSIVFAHNPRQWYARVRYLLTDDDYRAQLVRDGRAASRTWTYEANARRWWNAWTGDTLTAVHTPS